MRDGIDKWFIREYVSGTQYNRATWSQSIATDQWYQVEITLASDGNVTLAVDGTTLGSYKFSSAISGQVGAGVQKAHAQFDNYCVNTSGVTSSEGESVISANELEQVLAYIPDDFTVSPNYPNPFNPETRVNFSLPEPVQVVVKVYNIHGQEVRTLIDGNLGAGLHTVSWNATDNNGIPVNSGTYLMAIRAGEQKETVKMLLLK